VVVQADITAADFDPLGAEQTLAATVEILAWARSRFPGLREGPVAVWALPWPPSPEVRQAGLQNVSARVLWFPTFSMHHIVLVPSGQRGSLASALAVDQMAADWERLPMALRLGIGRWWQDHAPGVREGELLRSDLTMALAQIEAEVPYRMVLPPAEPVAADDAAGAIMAALIEAAPALRPGRCRLQNGTTEGLRRAWAATDPDPAETAVGHALAHLVDQTIGFPALHALCRAATERGEEQLPVASLLSALGVQDQAGVGSLLVSRLDRATCGEQLLQTVRVAALRHDLAERGIPEGDPAHANELATRAVRVCLGENRELVEPPALPAAAK
jgi:hypothetical protein